MVPLIRVEEAIRETTGLEICNIVALPDAQKGERLVAFHLSEEMDGKQINRAMAATSVPRLWIPKAESIHRIEEMPMLPTGKLDIQRLKALALELDSVRTASKESGAAEELAQ